MTVNQLNDNVGSLTSQTVFTMFDGMAAQTVLSARGSSGYNGTASPKSISLMGDLLR